MNPAKIHLSANELALVQDGSWLLTKNTIIAKVIALFGEVAHAVRDQIGEEKLPSAITHLAPKIAKGENYKGLPYVMLDYPRLFSKEEVFAIRTMFWWGNYFSVTLHLKGAYQQQYVPVILEHTEQLRQHDLYIPVTNDEWQHDLSEENYTRTSRLLPAAIASLLSENNFCKLSAKMPLQEWNQSVPLLVQHYQVIFQLLKN